MVIVLVGGSPDSISLLAATIADFEAAGPVRYISKEKPNACSYIFKYPQGVDLNLEFLRTLTIRINEIFVHVVEENKTSLFHEGKVKVYPRGS